MTEDEMVKKHHQLNRQEFEQTLGDSQRQRSLYSISSQRFRHNLVSEKQQMPLGSISEAETIEKHYKSMEDLTSNIDIFILITIFESKSEYSDIYI